MKFRQFKRFLLVTGVFIGSFGSLQADSNQTDLGTQSPKMIRYQPPTQEITPNAGPKVQQGLDVFITADFIWWKATQDGTEYAATGIQFYSPPILFENVPKGEAKTVGEDWAPGFKIGLGLNLDHGGWDLYAQYTWLHAHNSNSISNRLYDRPGVIGQTFGVANEIFILGDRATGSWDLRFNVIDLELGRNFYLDQFMTMRPFIGLKGT